MIKRTSKKKINKLLKANPSWNVLDIGCGYTANDFATVVADVQDFSNYYSKKKFIQITEKKLPFKENEFDFVITSHVIEHVEDIEFFIKEIERIAKRGYIELPSRLADNLVFENLKDHIWWFAFDDDEQCLVTSKKNQLIEPFITVSTAKKLEKLFQDSLIMSFLWENKIDFRVDASLEMKDEKKMSFFYLIKKYFSKKIRNIIRKSKDKK